MSKKLLLVEDESLIALNEAKTLEKHGYEVVTAYSGEKAVEMVNNDPEISLILMDIDLGKGIDGTEAAQEILKRHDLPIVFLTSHSEKEYVDRVRKITSYGYVLKNSGEFVLIESIHMAFELFVAHKRVKIENEERIKTQAKQRETVLLYRHLMENSIDAVYLLSEDGHVLNVNSVACEMIGYTRDELLDLTIDDIDPNYPSHQFKEFWKEKPAGSTLLFETLHRHKSGEIIPVEVNGIFFLLDGERYLFGVARDIRMRKRNERALRESEEKYRRIFDNAPTMFMEVDMSTYEILSCNPAMAKSLGMRPGEAEGRNIKNILPKEVFERREIVARKAFETNSVQSFVDEREGRYFQNTFISVIEEDRQILQTITEEITERILSQRQYEEKEKNFRALAESARVGITVIQQNRIVYTNSSALELSGYGEDEIDKMDIEGMIEQIHPEDREFVAHTYMRQVNELSESGHNEATYPPIEYRHIRRDGSVVWTEAHTSAIEYDGKPALLVVHNDLSERKRTEERLEINAERYRKAQRLGRVGNWEYNIQSTEFWGSEEAKRIYGFDPKSEHFSTEEVERCIPERGRVHQALIDLIEEGKAYDIEFDIITCDKGERKTIASLAELERDAHGLPLKVTGVIQDISERKSVEEELKQSEKRRRNAQKLANIGYWDWYMNTGELAWSEEVFSIFGQDPGSFSVTAENFESLIHPEDFEAFVDERESALSEARDIDIEHRIIKPDGEIRYVHEIAEILRDAAGEVKQVSGVVQDITERKRVEENLRETLEEKDFLMRELNHRVKNNLALVSSLISLKDSESEEDLSDLTHRIEVIRSVYEKLLQQSDIERIEVKEYFQKLLNSIFSSTNRGNVELVNNISDVSIPTKTAFPLALIINEIATNAVKYGFTADEKARFTITLFEEKESRHYILNLSNTGNPFPEDVGLENPETMGMQLASTLVAQLDGTIELQKKPNPVFTIRFPLGDEV